MNTCETAKFNIYFLFTGTHPPHRSVQEAGQRKGLGSIEGLGPSQNPGQGNPKRGQDPGQRAGSQRTKRGQGRDQGQGQSQRRKTKNVLGQDPGHGQRNLKTRRETGQGHGQSTKNLNQGKGWVSFK